ncbi:hypothetical protein [Burkholderia latens]|uniref:hypothetical protein n=1 Tax=Burkholderia latens TaxID=488446 RepID=UPI00158B3101|nr:hypothetical protein [Burkholderia latens]
MNNVERISAFLAISERFLCGTQRVHDDRRRPQPMPVPTRDTIASRVARGGGVHVWDDVSGHAAGHAAGRDAAAPVRDARRPTAMGSHDGERR